MNAKTVFLDALELEDSARAHYVAEACAGDAGLEARVNALIRAHHDANETERHLAELSEKTGDSDEAARWRGLASEEI